MSYGYRILNEAYQRIPAGPDVVTDLMDRATAHGDEQVITFADTAADAYEHTGDTDALAAALRAATLIPRRPALPTSRPLA